MNNFKRILSLFLCFTMLIAFSVVTVSAATTIEFGNYTLAVNGDNTYSLYKYNGTSSFATIPAEANGMPVVSISSYCFEGSNAKYVMLTDNITSIRDYAFYGAEKLVSVVIPSTVTSIGNYAFAQCPLLKTVDFSDDCVIDTFAIGLFQGCTSMTKVEIPASVKTIKGSFLAETSVESVVIPDTVTSIGNSAFTDCSALTSVELSSNLKALGAHTFSGCTALESVKIPEGVKTIGNRCFYDCTALTNAEIPFSCTSIGIKAFYNCTSLSSIFIPRNVDSIGADCFYPMSIKKKIVANGFTDTYAEEYSLANGVDFTNSNASIGDTNNDGTVDISDVTAIQKHLAKITLIDSSEKISYADSSKDGVLSIRDATRIQMFVAFYIEEF